MLAQITVAQVQEIPDSWEVKEGTYDGNILLLRKNSGLEDVDEKLYYSMRTGISFRFNRTADNGFPDQNETARLDQLEDDIFYTFQNDNKALVSIIKTESAFLELKGLSKHAISITPLLLFVLYFNTYWEY